ncbi:MAG: Uma2 family endonuclease, partial [Clostridium sp.]
LKNKPCKAFSEQIEVIMGKDRVKPDIFVVCMENDEFKTKGQSFLTMPTVIFEVVSKSNSTLDTIVKMELYAKFGVKEYNLVYQEGYIQQYKLTEENTYYLNKSYDLRDEYNSIELTDFKLSIKDVFDFL